VLVPTSLTLAAGDHGTDPNAVASDRLPRALSEALTAQGVDWHRPLSVASVRAWRSRLRDKHDTVNFDGTNWILTTVSRGALRTVQVTARWDTYRIVRQLFEFEGIGQIEITELDTASPGHATSANAVPSSTPRERPASTAAPAATQQRPR
jgi:hypothetical protein